MSLLLIDVQHRPRWFLFFTHYTHLLWSHWLGIMASNRNKPVLPQKDGKQFCPCPKLSLSCISLLYLGAPPYKLCAQCAVRPGATCTLQFVLLIYLSASFRMCQLCVICHCL